MTTNVLNVISAMAEAASTAGQGALRPPIQPVVTLSRDYGAGGEEIAVRLAERLRIQVYDDELLRQIAAQLEADPATVRMLDESFHRAKDMWFYRLISGKDVGPAAYRHSLVNVVLSLARLGGVIVGRGAHVILAESCALRVRIAGTPAVCARRLAEAGRASEAEELAKARKVNQARGKFVWEMFGSRLADAHQFDVTINTDRMNDFGQVVDMLVPMAQATHAGRVLGPSLRYLAPARVARRV
jgi:cytidylate kinase